jgi:hypothetical protein
VFPEVPIRQWVLSLPHRVRYLLARRPELCRELRGIFARAVPSFYGRRAEVEGHVGGRCGSVVQIQRSDAAIRLDVHFHGLFLDGVYVGFEPGGGLAFHRATHLTDDEVRWMVRHIRALIFGHLRRRGCLDEEAALVEESEPELELDELATYQAAGSASDPRMCASLARIPMPGRWIPVPPNRVPIRANRGNTGELPRNACPMGFPCRRARQDLALEVEHASTPTPTTGTDPC